MAKGGLQRQRFAEKQQRNRIIRELEGMYASGMTVEQVRATRRPAQQVTVTDSDNLSTIANANGIGEADVLAANPDVNQLRTGMVINVPGSGGNRPNIGGGNAVFGSIGGDKAGGIGLPSAGPLGAAPGGLSTYQDPRANAGRGTNANFATPGITTPTSYPGYGPAAAQRAPSNLFGSQQNTQPRPGAWNPNAFATPAEQYTGSNNYQPPVATPNSQGATTPGLPRIRQFAPRENHVTLLDSITNQVGMQGATPSELQLKLLINSGRVKKAGNNNSIYGGGGFGNNRRRGGGGGGGNRSNLKGGGGYQDKEPRMPAFSNGSGSFGLINWRI